MHTGKKTTSDSISYTMLLKIVGVANEIHTDFCMCAKIEITHFQHSHESIFEKFLYVNLGTYLGNNFCGKLIEWPTFYLLAPAV